jgi:hypothetical protein
VFANHTERIPSARHGWSIFSPRDSQLGNSPFGTVVAITAPGGFLMNRTSRVLVAMGAVTLMSYGTALAQAAAEPPQAPPSAPPSAAPASPAAQSPSSAQAQTATGELVSVDAKENSIKVKTSTGEVTIKYNDDTKVTGASRNTAGLATMSGSQVMVSYKKDGASNMATSIEVKPAASAAPRPAPAGGVPGDRPSPGAPDRPSPGAPPTPRP